MARSVVLAGTVRCEGCLLPPRWCVCRALGTVATPLQVDVLLHHREQWRPTSTGKLIQRVVDGARIHDYRRGVPRVPVSIAEPGRELWILHPRGEPFATIAATPPDPARVQVLLLDGSWNEAGQMLREVEPWGRRVSLPLGGTSRYLLREQQGEGRLSTVEALMGLLDAFGLHAAGAQLRLHFELHVYATLRARGHKSQAAEYLGGSPIKDA
ncbi:MAG: DTW domain-containing protein, partial [Verrucomicrobia bacterium]